MRIFALTIILLMVILVAFRGSLDRKQPGQVFADAHDYRYLEPFARSKVAHTLATACGNCHSNHTILPWYGHVAPISWWLKSHVREGRQELNFSEWDTYSARQQRDELESICGVISNGRMPPAEYTAVHPEARLAPKDKKAICAWTAMEIDR